MRGLTKQVLPTSAFEPMASVRSCHSAQEILRVATNEWVQLEADTDGAFRFNTDGGIVFDSRYTRIADAHSRLDFTARREDILGAGGLTGCTGSAVSPSRDECTQLWSFPGNHSLTTAGYATVRLGRLEGGGGVLSAAVAAAIVAGTGTYKGCTGAATFLLSAYLKPWSDDLDLVEQLLAGFEALVNAEFSLVPCDLLERREPAHCDGTKS